MPVNGGLDAPHFNGCGAFRETVKAGHEFARIRPAMIQESHCPPRILTDVERGDLARMALESRLIQVNGCSAF